MLHPSAIPCPGLVGAVESLGRRRPPGAASRSPPGRLGPGPQSCKESARQTPSSASCSSSHAGPYTGGRAWSGGRAGAGRRRGRSRAPGRTRQPPPGHASEADRAAARSQDGHRPRSTPTHRPGSLVERRDRPRWREAPGTRRCSLDPAVSAGRGGGSPSGSCARMPSNFTSRAQSSPSGTVPGRANMGLTKAGNLTVWLTPRTLAAAGGERLCSGRPLGENAAYSDAGDAGYGDETTILAIV